MTDQVPSKSGRYRKVKKLGEGTYGVVWHATDVSTGRAVALKITHSDEHGQGIPSTSIRECAVLREIGHPNVVTIEDIYIENSNCHIVFEFMETDLHKFIAEKVKSGEYRQPEWPTRVKKFAHQIFLAINHCHANSILHRDLKPQNILLNNNAEIVKVGDFGLARQVFVPGRTLTHEVVTLWYRAPEILLGSRRYGSPVDIWSLGCILLEMLTGRPAFPGDSEIDQIFRIFRLLGTPNESRWPAAMQLVDFKPSFPKWNPTTWTKAFPILKTDQNLLDFIQRIFQYDPFQRITAKEALQHPYFASLSSNNINSTS